jgi:hypothetical protein
MTARRETLTTDVLRIASGPIGSTLARVLALGGRCDRMLEATAQLSQRPGEHRKNAFTYQRDIDRFARIIRSVLYPLFRTQWTGHLARPCCFRPGATTAPARIRTSVQR